MIRPATVMDLPWLRRLYADFCQEFHSEYPATDVEELDRFVLAIVQADYLGQVRTGAASGVATKYLARPDAATVGLYGTGKQARTQLLAVCQVRAIKHITVFSRSVISSSAPPS